MAKTNIPVEVFEALYSRIIETTSVEKKLCAIEESKGDLNHSQIVTILNAMPSSPAKVEAVRLLQNRLRRMTCEDACAIFDAVPIHNDKLVVLNMIKRAICDATNAKAIEMIMTAFPFEADKIRAAHILHTVQTFSTDKIPAGGHQGYATVGFLYGQAPPLDFHLYGSIEEQLQRKPGHGFIAIPPQAMTDTYPSMYTSHPSYAYRPPTNYSYVNKMPGANRWPVVHSHGEEEPPTYPAGAPPIHQHSGAPSPVGYPGLNEN